MLDLLFIKQIKVTIKGNYSPIINSSRKTKNSQKEIHKKINTIKD